MLEILRLKNNIDSIHFIALVLILLLIITCHESRGAPTTSLKAECFTWSLLCSICEIGNICKTYIKSCLHLSIFDKGNVERIMSSFPKESYEKRLFVSINFLSFLITDNILKICRLLKAFGCICLRLLSYSIFLNW